MAGPLPITDAIWWHLPRGGYRSSEGLAGGRIEQAQRVRVEDKRA